MTNFTNVSYLTGFTGDDSYLLLGGKHSILLSDERYTTQLQEECPDLELSIRGPGKKMLASVEEVITRAKVKRLGIEADSMSVAMHMPL